MSERAVEELLSDVSWAIAQRLPKRDLLAMLARLVKGAEPGSPEERFAKLELARLALDKQPFRDARLLQEVLLGGLLHTSVEGCGARREGGHRATEGEAAGGDEGAQAP